MPEAVKIHVHDLHKSFGSKVVLDGVNVDVTPDESPAIIGGSGKGKGELLTHVNGLRKPDSGTGEVVAQAVEQRGNRQRAFRIAERIAMLHQGKIIAEAPPEELRRLDDPRVQQFMHGKADGPLSEETPARGPRDSKDETGSTNEGTPAGAGARELER